MEMSLSGSQQHPMNSKIPIKQSSLGQSKQEEPASSSPSSPLFLPSSIVSTISRFVPFHLSLRSVSKTWKKGVEDAHRSYEHGCQSCICRTSYHRFALQRFLLPWLSKFCVSSKKEHATPFSVFEVLPLYDPIQLTPIQSCDIIIDADTVDTDLNTLNDLAKSSHFSDLWRLSIEVNNPEDFGPESTAKCASILMCLKCGKKLQRLLLHGFNFDYSEGAADFSRLASSFPDLRVLSANNCGITDACVELLSASPESSSIEVLELQENALTVAGIELLVSSSSHLQNISDLSLGYSAIGDEGVAVICASSLPTGLKELSVDGCSLSDAAVSSIISCGKFCHLKNLSLQDNAVSTSAVVSLLEAVSNQRHPLQSLRHLFLANNDVSGKDLSKQLVSRFAGTSKPSNLSDFTISSIVGRKFHDYGVLSLSSLPVMSRIKELSLFGIDEAVLSILLAPAVSSFTMLHTMTFLFKDALTWQGVRSLHSASSRSLYEIDFGSCLTEPDASHLDDHAAIELASCSTLSNLHVLTLKGCHLSVCSGIIALLSSSHFSSLKHLELENESDFIPTEYSMSAEEAADAVAACLQTTANGLMYLKLPKNEYCDKIKAILMSNRAVFTRLG